jgi:GT2 family glycosyltransferase
MKYSIVIIAYQAAGQLVKCLESLQRNPPPSGRTSKADAEIVIIDNSPEPIEKAVSNDLLVKLCQTYTRVIFEWHPENLGFAAGCNRGVALTDGEYIVLVNPDTEVFPEWSERLVAYMQPDVGAVGPISNFVAGWQNATLHMRMVDDHAKNARYAIKGNNRRGVDTKLLIGFFCMVRREAWNKIGGMDPQFFLGCDDLDLSLRLREAGYALVIASDVYVYHEGHASFHARGIESLELNKQAEKKMLAKLQAQYGDNIPSSTELWGCEILPTYIPKRLTLSVCMIVGSETEMALGAINDMGSYADEVVVVYTGSSFDDTEILLSPPDGTSGFTLHDKGIAIAGVQTNPRKKLYLFPWTDSFSEARNFALSKCTGDYVLWLDADDRVSEESAQHIRANLDHPGPLMQAQKAHIGLILRDQGPDGTYNYAHGQPRLFPRIPGLEWSGRVHESYIPAAEALDLVKVDTNIVIDHTGYKDPAVMLKKHARNLRLMEMEPDSPHKFYHMAKNCQALGRYHDAERYYGEVLSDRWAAPLEKPFFDQVRYCMATLIATTKGADPSIDACLEDNDKPDAVFLRAEVALKRGEVFKAEKLFKEYLAFEQVQDSHGSEMERLQAVCRERLAIIQGARDRAYAG